MPYGLSGREEEIYNAASGGGLGAAQDVQERHEKEDREEAQRKANPKPDTQQYYYDDTGNKVPY